MTADPATLDRARAHFTDGLAALQAGDAAAAAQAFEAALALAPGRASVLLNLAAARLQAGDAAGALHATRAVLASDPADREAHFHAGQALARLARPAEALAAFDAACAGSAADASPTAAAPWLRRGQVLHTLGRDGDALASYDRAIALDPALAEAWSYRGGLLREAGRLADADAAFAQAEAHGGDPALHAYYRAATAGSAQAPDAAPRHYVETLFDDYAAQFDSHLVGALRYRGHTALVELVQQRHPGGFDTALDLGCGTGLVGARIAASVGAIDGVDISAGMLAEARRRGVYRALVHQDVADHLHGTDARYGLVLAADVFIYLGALDAVFAGVQRVLAPGGVFAFTVERLPDADGDHALHPSLRYAHSESYVRRLAAAHGFAVTALQPATLRQDQQRAIEGLLVCLRRPEA